MSRGTWVAFLVGVFALGGIATGAGLAVMTHSTWREWFTKEEVKPKDPHREGGESIKLSAQARQNLGLKVQKLTLNKEPHWRTLQIPAQVVERPGNCDRLVTAPLAGIVKHIGAVKGDLVHAGDKLITLQLVGDQLLNAQANLYKTQRELEIVKQEQNRLAVPFKDGAIPLAKMIEVENQHQRLVVTLETLRHELAVRGFSPAELLGVAGGKFVTEVSMVVPSPVEEPKVTVRTKDENGGLKNDQSQVRFQPSTFHPPPASGGSHGYEIEKLFVKLGEQVQAGQALCHLADHHVLFIEGYVFGKEASSIYRAAREGLPIKAEFPQEEKGQWPTLPDLRLLSFANDVDPGNQTLAFHLVLPNQHHDYTAGKTYRLWRFRPGQRLHLQVPVESFTDVFVLPAEAMVREGPETYVFRQSGDFFERKAVHVIHEDRRVAVLANDGSILADNYVALNGAVQLNWALKAGGAKPAGHTHDH